MTPLTGRARTHDEMFADDAKPGDYSINEDGTYALLECPCGCGSMMNLPLYGNSSASSFKTSTPQWYWNGNRELPTLQPSIRDVVTCRFHGFLTNGVWTFCSDSGVHS